MAGGTDDRWIEERLWPVESVQERLDALPQLWIGRALTVQDRGACRWLVAFDGREEHGLDAFRVERHGMSPLRRVTLPDAVRDCENIRIAVDGVAELGAGVSSFLANNIISDAGGGRHLLEPRAGELAKLDRSPGSSSALPGRSIGGHFRVLLGAIYEVSIQAI